MQAQRTFPAQIMRALATKGLVPRFNADMQRLDTIAKLREVDMLNIEAAQVLTWVSVAVGVPLAELKQLLLASAPAPDPRRLMVPIASRLFAERERLGLSRQQMADIGGVSLDDQSAYERGLSVAPPSHYLAQIARDAGIDVLYVLTGRREGSNAHA